MFVLYADKNNLTVRRREPVTSGSVNVSYVQFEFSEDWEGMTRTAVFKAGEESRCVLLDESGVCAIPWEVLAAGGRRLTAGVCGTLDGDTVLPTVWANLGIILEGAKAGQEAQPPTPELWEQALAGKQDRLTGLPGQVVGFDKNGRAAARDAAGKTPYRYLVADGLSRDGACQTTIFEEYEDPVSAHEQLRLDLWFTDAGGNDEIYTSVFVNMPKGERCWSVKQLLPVGSETRNAFGVYVDIDAESKTLMVSISDEIDFNQGWPIRLTIGYLPAEQKGGGMELIEVL